MTNTPDSPTPSMPNNPRTQREKTVIGFLIGAVLSACFCLYGLYVLDDAIKELMLVMVGIVAVVGILFLLFTIFKERIFLRVFGVKHSDLPEVTDAARELMGSLLEKDVEKAQEHFATVSNKASAWYLWQSYRRWVVAVFTALFVGFGGLLASVLVYNQNQLIKTQNELFSGQNSLFDKQNTSVRRQNRLIETQNNLLLNQNNFVERQNRLLEKQNLFVEQQTTLVGNQNELLGKQNLFVEQQVNLLDQQNHFAKRQTDLVDNQNQLIKNQNTLVEKQTKRLDQQTNLQEANRRSALVFLFSNILDKVDEELKNDKEGKRQLSPQLIGRIVALSNRLEPYRYLDVRGDSLITKSLSPERGQLLTSLLESRLDTTTYDQIFAAANFSHANLNGWETSLDTLYLKKINLGGANLWKADLNKANLRKADLNDVDLSGADLREANLSEADLREANLSRVDLREANLSRVDLREANLWKANLQEANLWKADLSRAYLWETNLSRAYLGRADLRKANLWEANLSGAHLSETNLQGADLRRANLSGTHLTMANLWEARVKTKNWFQNLSKLEHPPIGLNEFTQKYYVDTIPQQNKYGSTYYLIKSK